MSKDDRSQQTSRRTWPSWPSLHAGNLQKEATGCSDSAHRWQSVDVHRSFAAGQRRMMPWQHESVLDGCVLFSLLPYPYLNSQLSRHHHHQLAVAITRQRKSSCCHPLSVVLIYYSPILVILAATMALQSCCRYSRLKQLS